jgi:hypothetical protein
MSVLPRLLRRWLDVDAQRHDARKTARTLATLSGQVTALQGLIHHQTDVTLEALRTAGWVDPDDLDQSQAVQRALQATQGTGDLIVGPWTGEVGFELLYWIPFLNWLVTQGLNPARLVVVSRGGAAPWYRHLTPRYVDLLDLMTADEFRERTSDRKRKQYSATRGVDVELVDRVRTNLGLQKAEHIHPSVMFRLFHGHLRRGSSLDVVESFTSFRRLAAIEGHDPVLDGLPPRYVTVKFYFSSAFPDTPENRTFVEALLKRISRVVPVVLLSTSLRLDDHHDFATTGTSGIHVVDAHREPQKNLERQTRILAGSTGFVGTYGGFSYLAPFYGVRSVSFFSRRHAFRPHHLELADRVFDRLMPGGFLALHRDALELVVPAVAEWASAPASVAEGVLAR